MTNRAHHPADRDSGEFASDERRAPGASESGPVAVEEAVSDKYVAPTATAPITPDPVVKIDASDDEDDDAEEVVPEPDSVEPALAEGPTGEGDVLSAAGETSGGSVDSGQEATDLEAVSPGDAALPARDDDDAAEVNRVEAADARRVSSPPPLPLPDADKHEASRAAAFTGASAVEVTAAELEHAAATTASDRDWSPPGDAESRDGSVAKQSARRPSDRPPWVDEVPDPITPYEKRISETVKVADLPPVEQLRGRVLANRYLAEEVAEHTAFGISYRAYHLALDRAVTVRVLLRGLACSDEACQEVRRVAAAATALENPHVASTLDFGVLSDGWPFVVTEYFQGATLAKLLSSEGKFVLRRVLHVGKQIALGLSAAHEKGIVHGLLCPDNVLIVEPGSSAEIVKILGFGIAKARGSVPGPPRSGVFGVPFYLSPEQAACRAIDERSDIYSCGVLLYELMTGAPPFSDGDFAGVLCQHLDDDAPPPSSRLTTPGALAKAIDAIVERCLRKEPEKRYQSAAELVDDLTRLEAAAARSKRRPMPEVQKPTTTIHSPHRKAEAPEMPGAKVIVHDDVDDPSSPEPPEASAPRSSPSLARSSPGAPSGITSKTPPSSPGAGQRSVQPPLTPVPSARDGLARPPRVRVDQATIKISAVDRERLLNERPSSRNSSWLGSVVAAIRRLLATEGGGRSDDTR
jgi:serine/threonine protein kinase